MTPPRLAVAPHFHLARGWEDRLWLRLGGGWRPASAEEASPLLLAPGSPREALDGAVALFLLPGHLRSAFWQMLDEAGIDEAGFQGFVAEVARFLAFKQLPAPAAATFDLVLCRPGQAAELDLRQVWGLVNLAEECAAVAFGEVRVALGAGEGCRLPPGTGGEVWPPEGEEPGVFLVVRRPAPEA